MAALLILAGWALLSVAVAICIAVVSIIHRRHAR